MNVRTGSVSFDIAFSRARAFLRVRTIRPAKDAAYLFRYPITRSARTPPRHASQYLVPRKQGRQSAKLIPQTKHSK